MEKEKSINDYKVLPPFYLPLFSIKWSIFPAKENIKSYLSFQSLYFLQVVNYYEAVIIFNENFFQNVV